MTNPATARGRANKTRYVLLGLLGEGPKSGYDLKQEIESVIDHFWKESYGQIYPTLRELCAEGLVTKRAADAGGRRRDTYTITAAGRRELARWLAVPPEIGTFRHEILLKLFFGRHTDVETLIGHVEAYRQRVTATRGYMAAARREVHADVPPHEQDYWLLTIRSGELISEAGITWADEALAVLRRARDAAEAPGPPAPEHDSTPA